MLTIEQKLQKRINSIVQMTGEYPEQIEITKEEAEQIRKDTFRNVKLIIKN